MPDYSLCPNFVKLCITDIDPDDVHNRVFIKFLKVRECRISIDEQKSMFKHYTELAKNSEKMSYFLDSIEERTSDETNKFHDFFDVVSFSEKEITGLSLQELAIEISRKSSRSLIVKSVRALEPFYTEDLIMMIPEDAIREFDRFKDEF